VTAAGLSNTPQEYRERLDDQSDEQIDTWAGELMRDVSIRRGVREVLHGFRAAMDTDDAGLRRLYSAGGGPAAAVGTTERGELMMPAISLYYLVGGARKVVPDARSKLIEYIVANFEEIVYI
jgi:hypothetical protein